MASGDSVQQIKDRLSIVDVVAPYVELHAAGKNMKGKSPFTNEKTPSFYVSPDRGMYYCFSSSQGGDIFTFVEKMEGVDFKGALKILADKAGVELVPEDPKKRTERDTQYAVLEAATQYFVGELTKHKEAHSYVTDRGVKEDTITHWRIGYVPGPPKNGWRHTKEALSAQGYTDTQLLHAGLIKSAGEGKAPYDVFRDRLMFPIADASGRVVAFSGRLLAKDSEAPKYVNSPETELFNKSEILFGYDKAKQGIRQLDFSLIVEGQFDVVLAHQAGYHNTVAVSGTALTAHHVSLLQRLSNRVVLALDSDRAGIAAVKRAAELMLARGMDLKVATLPAGKDPADIIKDDASQFKKYIGEAKHVIEFLLDVIEAEATNERSFKLRVRDEVLPYVVRIESHIDREHFAGVIAERLSSTQDAVMLEVARLETKVDTTPVSEPAADTPKEAPNEDREQGLVAYLLVAADVVGAPLSKRIYEAVEEVTGDIARELKQKLPPEVLSQLVFSIEEQFATFAPKHIKEELTDRLVQLEDCVYRRNVRALKEALSLAERDGDTEAVETYLKELTTWQQKHQHIGSIATFLD